MRSIAFYLPQFHPIPENDQWWGPGFTEWTNVAKARRRFPRHYQPRLPGELGFYDLRVPETRAAQADLARTHGISAFCYWHYWFGNGRTLLGRPFSEVLTSGEPDFPFCLGWANGSWTGTWHGSPGRVLIEQTYPGDDDHRAHFDALVPALVDPRYYCIEARPVVFLHSPNQIPDLGRFADAWREAAAAAGLGGLFLIGQTRPVTPPDAGVLDAWVTMPLPGLRFDPLSRIMRKAFGLPRVASYRHYVQQGAQLVPGCLSYPAVLPGWDNTARSGSRGIVLHAATPQLFKRQVEQAKALVQDRGPEHQLVFVKSWNEWAEGNYMEPDRRYGRAFLEAFRDAFADTASTD